MSRPLRAVALLLICPSLVFGAPAARAGDADAHRAFAAARDAFARKDYSAAAMLFEQAREQGLTGPAVYYDLGVCYYKSGDYRAARAAFETVARDYPAMRALAQYNLGLVALKQGDRAHAGNLFRDAARNAEDEKLRRLAQLKLQALAPTTAPPRWFSMVDTRIGHDGNVLLLAEDTALSSGQSAASNFTRLFAVLSGPLASSPGFRLDASLYSVNYPDASFFNETAVRIGTVYQWRWSAWRAEAGPHYEYSVLDGGAFERLAGLDLRFRRSLTASTALAFRFAHDEASKGETRFAFLEGSRDSFEAQIDSRTSIGRLTFAYALELNDRVDPGVSPTRNKLSVRYRRSFEGKWRADLAYAYRVSRYGDLAQPRTEDLGEFSASLARDLPRGWELGGELSLGRNRSNLEAVSYDRTRVALGFSKEF